MPINRDDLPRVIIWLIAIGVSVLLAKFDQPAPGGEGTLGVLDLPTILGMLFIPSVVVGMIAAWKYVKSDTVRAFMVFELVAIFVVCSQLFVLVKGNWLSMSRDFYRSCCVPPPSAEEMFVTGLLPWLIGLGAVSIASTPFLRPMLRRRLRLDEPDPPG